MAYALVQGTNNNVGASPLAVSFTNTPVAGNLMLCSIINQSSQTMPTVSDSGGNWTLLNSKAHSTTSKLYLFGKIAVTAQPKAITATQAGDQFYMSLYEFSGNVAIITSIIDASNSADNTAGGVTTTSGSQPSVTATNANDLLFTQVAWPATVTAPSATASGGAAMQAGQSAVAGAIKLFDAYAFQATTGTFSPYVTWTTAHSWTQMTTALLPTPTAGFLDFI